MLLVVDIGNTQTHIGLMDEGVVVSVALEFAPELIEIVDDYFFRQSITSGAARG